MKQVDIAVIGAGPIGSAMAIGLAREGFRVALVEQQASPSQKIGETLPPEIQQPLSCSWIMGFILSYPT